MLNRGSMVWGFCVYFVYMIPLETDVLRKHRFQKREDLLLQENNLGIRHIKRKKTILFLMPFQEF